jgi:U3 small nucleolar RNA-associated protein 14
MQEKNPWLLLHDSSSSKTTRKRNEIVVGKGSNQILKTQNKLRKQGLKHDEERAKAADEAAVEIDMEQAFTLPSSSKSGPSALQNTFDIAATDAKTIHKNTNGNIPCQGSDSDSDANDELEEQERIVDLKGKGKARGPKAFEQRDLVARAFAGDDVTQVSLSSCGICNALTFVQAFEETKRLETEGDAPTTIDTTIEGWVRRADHPNSKSIIIKPSLCRAPGPVLESSDRLLSHI